uniref:C-X-C motif chemokine ligand 8 n=1 Tax=Homo sapiens TaxID=9606 RepID=A0A8Q3SIG6_HUMAN
MTSKLAVALLAAFLISAALCEGKHIFLTYSVFLCLNVILR